MEIALALGGGGVRGAAHIGVLQVLEQEGFRIKALAGSSIGGLIGAVYLSGISPDQMRAEFVDLEMKKLYGRKRGDEPSLLGLDGMTKLLSRMLGDKTFADLPVPFATTAVDINTGEIVVFQDGLLIEAVLATIAVPGVFPARRWNDRLLVDGGVLCPVPIAQLRMLRPDLPLVAVALNQTSLPGKGFAIPETTRSNPVVEYVTRLRLAQALNVFIRSTEHSSVYLTELLLKVEKPDVIILPDMHDIGMLDAIDAAEIALRGENAARSKLGELRAVGKPKAKVLRWMRSVLGETGA